LETTGDSDLVVIAANSWFTDVCIIVGGILLESCNLRGASEKSISEFHEYSKEYYPKLLVTVENAKICISIARQHPLSCRARYCYSMSVCLSVCPMLVMCRYKTLTGKVPLMQVDF